MDHAMPDRREPLAPLLGYLASASPQTATRWGGWWVTPIRGGSNNRLYRVARQGERLAVKFCLRDARDRAGREHDALLALQQAGIETTPRPILLDRSGYGQPLVVQTWLDGEPLGGPPSRDEDWEGLLRHLVNIHELTPDASPIPLRQAVLTMMDAASGKQRIMEQFALIPAEVRPVSLRDLVARVAGSGFSAWSEPRPALCRCDATPGNFLHDAKGWGSVDWEYSGWGDAALDIADLIAHPACAEVPASRWSWVIDRYCSLSRDAEVAVRIRVYHALLLAYWAARLARYLYEVPRGLDRRLVDRPPGWLAETRTKYEQYLERALAALA